MRAPPLLLVALCAPALAVPVKFSFTSWVTISEVPGTVGGLPLTIEVIADNGGSSLASQSWGTEDFISGSLRTGDYQQHYVDGWFSVTGFVVFRTDAAGELKRTDFLGTTFSDQHTDSFGSGGGIYLFSNAFQDHEYRIGLYRHRLDATRRWEMTALAQAAAVPEPGTALQMVPGAAALAAAGLRSRSSSRSRRWSARSDS